MARLGPSFHVCYARKDFDLISPIPTWNILRSLNDWAEGAETGRRGARMYATRRQRAARCTRSCTRHYTAVSFVLRERGREGGFSEFTCWSDRATDGLGQRGRGPSPPLSLCLSSAVSRRRPNERATAGLSWPPPGRRRREAACCSSTLPPSLPRLLPPHVESTCVRAPLMMMVASPPMLP